MDFDTYVQMGGYAMNVWGSYGIGIVGYGALLAHALWRYDRLRVREKQAAKK
ncbi:MAG TPA: heme exporter protein CcmD [Alphaproteobacteria bacterium]